jgi:hypothetical protein
VSVIDNFAGQFADDQRRWADHMEQVPSATCVGDDIARRSRGSMDRKQVLNNLQ